MLHISKSRNNNNNSLLHAPPGDQIAQVAHLQRQQQQEQPFSVQIEAKKEQEQQQQVYASLNRIQHAIQNVN